MRPLFLCLALAGCTSSQCPPPVKLISLPDAVATASAHQLVCTENDSFTRKELGWKPVQSADTKLRSRLAGEGKVKLEFVPGSLHCTYWLDGKPVIDGVPAGLLYWRKN